MVFSNFLSHFNNFNNFSLSRENGIYIICHLFDNLLYLNCVYMCGVWMCLCECVKVYMQVSVCLCMHTYRLILDVFLNHSLK